MRIVIVISEYFYNITLRRKVYNNLFSGQNCKLFHVGMYTNNIYKVYFNNLNCFWFIHWYNFLPRTFTLHSSISSLCYCRRCCIPMYHFVMVWRGDNNCIVSPITYRFQDIICMLIPSHLNLRFFPINIFNLWITNKQVICTQ